MNSQPVETVAAAEVARFADLIEQRRRGAVDEEDFRRFRLQHGVYGIRGQTDVQMVRVRIPYGALAAAQLECLGEIAEMFARGIGHITTRQDVQFHWVPLDVVPQVLRRLVEVGLTTREAGGNIVRNVTACPLAGVCATERFDVTLYAAALSRRLLRNPVCQALPRKFKIAFSGCAVDCAMTGIHDIGAVATVQAENGAARRGFRLYLGGGLGPAPHAAQLLEPFTPVEDLILTAEAIVRVFDRLGNRRNRARARMKFLVEDLGIEEFRRLVLEERRVVWASQPGALPSVPEVTQSAPAPVAEVPVSSRPIPPGFEAWCKSNVVQQKQAGFCTAFVTVPGGDLTANQFRALAALARQFPGSEIRATMAQNIVLRWVREEWLPGLYATLVDAGLGQPGVHSIADVVGCPGADTCNLAVTYSHRLALELSRQLAERPDIFLAEDLKGVTIKVSGCPNACGQHHIAAIGLYGAVRRVDGYQVPHYQLLLGGEVRDGEAIFGESVMRIPARRVPEAIFRLIERYRAERVNGETFLSWVRRMSEM
jgi:sulfite reductase beta subunit-like hemoprotein